MDGLLAVVVATDEHPDVPDEHVGLWIGINQLRGLMPRMVWRAPACDGGLDCLENYHAAPQSAGGIARDLPVHDWTSHAADALRMLAEAMAAGLVPSGLTAEGQGRKRRAGAITGLRG
jgi:hypothetical protein